MTQRDDAIARQGVRCSSIAYHYLPVAPAQRLGVFGGTTCTHNRIAIILNGGTHATNASGCALHLPPSTIQTHCSINNVSPGNMVLPLGVWKQLAVRLVCVSCSPQHAVSIRQCRHRTRQPTDFNCHSQAQALMCQHFNQQAGRAYRSDCF